MVEPADRPATPRPDARCRGQAVDRYDRDPFAPAATAMAAARSGLMPPRLPRSTQGGANGAADWRERRRPRDDHTAKRRREAFPDAGAGHRYAEADCRGVVLRIVAETVVHPGCRLAGVAVVDRAAWRQATIDWVTQAR